MIGRELMKIFEWKDKLLEILFPTPRICPICQKKQSRLEICADCTELLSKKRLYHGQCQRCGTFGIRAQVCDNCRKWPAYLNGNISFMPYDGKFKESILNYKYHHSPWLASAFAEMMAPAVPQVDLLIPVPLHPKRLRERGYNQSELLCVELNKLLGIAVETKVLYRQSNTPHQTGLSRTARQENLKNAFSVNHSEQIQNRHVLLVDDVLTTGATILQCAKVLHQAGAKTITAMTIASGQR